MRKRMALALVVFAWSAPALALSIGQLDDFEDGTTQAWQAGLPLADPIPVADGGPAGAGDGFLQYQSSGGSGPSSRMVVYNPDTWAGDYVSAGIGAISLDANNLGAGVLELRLAFGNSVSANIGSWYASTNAVVLAPGSGWQSVVFPILESDLTQVLGTDGWATVLGSASVMRILSSSAPSNKGDVVVGALGLDNVLALGSAPEPAALPWLAALGGLALLAAPFRRT